MDFKSVLSDWSIEGNKSGVKQVQCLLYRKECIGWMPGHWEGRTLPKAKGHGERPLVIHGSPIGKPYPSSVASPRSFLVGKKTRKKSLLRSIWSRRCLLNWKTSLYNAHVVRRWNQRLFPPHMSHSYQWKNHPSLPICQGERRGKGTYRVKIWREDLKGQPGWKLGSGRYKVIPYLITKVSNNLLYHFVWGVRVKGGGLHTIATQEQSCLWFHLRGILITW